jgi:hypothetical protein
LDGDGVSEIAVGQTGVRPPQAPGDPAQPRTPNAIWILFMRPGGSVLDKTKIEGQRGNLVQLAGLGDVDGDGIPDLAAAFGRDEFAESADNCQTVLACNVTARDTHAAVFLLRADGSARSVVEIDLPATSVTGPGDVNGDGIPDPAIGSRTAEYFSQNLAGAGCCLVDGVSVVFLDRTGSPLQQASPRITFARLRALGFVGTGDWFIGRAIASVLSPGTPPELIIGAPYLHSAESSSGPGGFFSGSLLPDGATHSVWKVVSGQSEQANDLGHLVASAGDVDGNGTADLVMLSDKKGSGGALLEFLYRGLDATVILTKEFELRNADGSEPGIHDYRAFASIDDLDGDGEREIAIARTGNLVTIGFGLPVPLPTIVAAEVPASYELNNALRFSVLAGSPTNLNLSSVSLSFRRSGDFSFFSVVMEPGGSELFEATVPAFAAGDRGIDFFFSVVDEVGHLSRLPAEGYRSIPATLPAGLTYEVPSGTSADGYRLRSVPGNLQNPRADSVFVDDFGDFDATHWRMFVEATGGGSLLEMGPTQVRALRPGHAFWVLARKAGRFDTGPLTGVPTDRPFERLLTSGWNLVGNPLVFPVPFSQLSTASGSSVDVRGYNGSWSTHEGSWLPGQGYAFFNPTGGPDTLFIDPDLSAVGTSTASKLSEDLDREIRISASKGSARDTDNVALLSPNASSGWDLLDRPEPPVIGD